MKTRLTFPFFLFILIFSSAITHAQTRKSIFRTMDQSVNIDEKADSTVIFLFDKFTPAVVYYPAKIAYLDINYKIFTDEMIAIHPEKDAMVLSTEVKFDSITVANKVFIYHPLHGYLQKIDNSLPLFIKMQGDYIINEITRGAYGSNPASASMRNYNSIDSREATTGNFDPLKNVQNTSGNEAEFIVTSQPTLVFIQDNNMITIKNRKNITDIFGIKSSAVRSFLRSEKIDFDNSEELIKLAAFIEKNR
jgi:hypothetical protein